MRAQDDTMIDSKQALELTTLKNRRVIGWLVHRGLLPRMPIGKRQFRYSRNRVLELVELAKRGEICLTDKPIKQL